MNKDFNIETLKKRTQEILETEQFDSIILINDKSYALWKIITEKQETPATYNEKYILSCTNTKEFNKQKVLVISDILLKMDRVENLCNILKEKFKVEYIKVFTCAIEDKLLINKEESMDAFSYYMKLSHQELGEFSVRELVWIYENTTVYESMPYYETTISKEEFKKLCEDEKNIGKFSYIKLDKEYLFQDKINYGYFQYQKSAILSKYKECIFDMEIRYRLNSVKENGEEKVKIVFIPFVIDKKWYKQNIETLFFNLFSDTNISNNEAKSLLMHDLVVTMFGCLAAKEFEQYFKQTLERPAIEWNLKNLEVNYESKFVENIKELMQMSFVQFASIFLLTTVQKQHKPYYNEEIVYREIYNNLGYYNLEDHLLNLSKQNHKSNKSIESWLNLYDEMQIKIVTKALINTLESFQIELQTSETEDEFNCIIEAGANKNQIPSNTEKFIYPFIHTFVTYHSQKFVMDRYKVFELDVLEHIRLRDYSDGFGLKYHLLEENLKTYHRNLIENYEETYEGIVMKEYLLDKDSSGRSKSYYINCAIDFVKKLDI